MTQQLVYGSADQIAGRVVGGWGVLHASPDLTAETQKALLPLCSVSMPQTLPQFPSSQELASRAVRFRVDPRPDALLACRSVEAGTDHTGRPGNVISHCALLDGVDAVRPADWFFADGWVEPFGPRQIADAVPPADLTAPSGWAGTAAWLREEPARVARVRWIVDVALTVLLSRGRLVLKAESTVDGARWASALSWLLPAPLGESVRIRAGEDARSVLEELATAPVIVTTSEALDPATLRGLPVVDTSLSLSDDGGVWVLPTGERFSAAPPTQVAADLAFAEPEVAAAVFAQRDALAERHLADAGKLGLESTSVLLRAAWLTTPGAQALAREAPIKDLLNDADATMLAWPELEALAAEVGEPGVAASPAEVDDIYSVADDPWAVDEPSQVTDAGDPLITALAAAALLGARGVDVAGRLREGTLLADIDQLDDDVARALRQVAAVADTAAAKEEEA